MVSGSRSGSVRAPEASRPGEGRPPRRAVLAVVAAGAGLAGLTWAWAFATPMHGFPDDVDHYLRAASVAQGQVLGEPNPVLEGAAVPVTKSCCGGPNPAMEYWVQAGLRKVMVPGELRPELIDCTTAMDRPRYGCGVEGPLDEAQYDTLMGTIEPAGYLPAGVALAIGPWGSDGFRVARVATAWFALLAVGLVLGGCASRPGFGRRVLGLCLATTPMVVFVVASGSPNAIETGAAIAVWLAVLELTADPPARAPRLLWVGLGVASVLLASARSLGPIWLGVIAVTAVVLRGRRPILDRLRVDRAPAFVTAALTAVAALSTVAWEAVVQPSVSIDRRFAASQVGDSLANVDRISHELIGVFGSVDIHLPDGVVGAWLLLVAAAVVVAVVTGDGRGRAALVVLVVALLGSYLAIDLLVMRQNGFLAQGRHVLAVAVGVPILAVEIVRVPDVGWRRASNLAVALVATAWGVAQVHAWAFAATSYVRTPTGLVLAAPFDGTWALPDPAPLVVVVALAAATFAAAVVAAVRVRVGTDPPASPGL